VFSTSTMSVLHQELFKHWFALQSTPLKHVSMNAKNRMIHLDHQVQSFTEPEVWFTTTSVSLLSFLLYMLLCSYCHFLCNNLYFYYFNKKLRYCKEHSMSIMLSWCTLWHYSVENLLMANLLLLCNGYRTYRIRQNNAK